MSVDGHESLETSRSKRSSFGILKFRDEGRTFCCGVVGCWYSYRAGTMCLLTGKIYCFRISIVLGVCLLLVQLHLIRNHFVGSDSLLIRTEVEGDSGSSPTPAASADLDVLVPVLAGADSVDILPYSDVDKRSARPGNNKQLHAIIPDVGVEKLPKHRAVNSETRPGGNSTKRAVKKSEVGNQHQPTTRLLILFSSWDHSSEKQAMHAAIFRLWSSWRPDVKPVMFTSDPIVSTAARSHKWDVRPVMKNPACKGPPVLTRFYTDSFHYYDAKFYGFANSDIAFGNGLVKTLEHIRHTGAYTNRSVLIVGRRTNFDFLRYKGVIDSPEKVKELLAEGKLVVRSTDYFFTNKKFPWGKLPLLSIGRPLIVRAILGYARMHNIDIIDATKTIEALHLTTADGDKSSWNKPGVYCNEYLLKRSKDGRKLPYGYGHVECAKLETYQAKDGTINIRSRDPNPKICKSPYS